LSESLAARNSIGGEGTRSLTADAIARLIGGQLLGEGATEVHGVAPLDRATPHDLSFLAGAKYVPALRGSRAGVVIVSQELADVPGTVSSRIVVREPYEAVLAVLPALYPTESEPTGIHPSATLGRGVSLGIGVSVGAYSTVGDHVSLDDGVVVGAHCSIGPGVHIGAKSRLFDAVTLYHGTRLGQRVRLHSGVRLGTDGFGYVFQDGSHRKIPHVGQCIVEDDVEIGANSTVDRGSIDDTVIGAGTKIDNLVHVAHNVRVGRLCLLMAQVGIAGSARIEDGCILAGQVGVAGHITIGAGARIAGQAGVFGDVPAGESWSGYPARPHKEALRAQAALLKLPGMIRQLARLIAERP